jgi:aminopeptidase N
MSGKARKHWRKDYRRPEHLVESVELGFDLRDDHALVRARLAVRRAEDAAPDAPLRLDGEELELLSLRVDGAEPAASSWRRTEEGGLEIDLHGAAAAVIETEVRIRPHANTALSGLYVSDGMYCTQCEAEGFRRITFYPDRPDVMARFRVRVEAERARFPVLLSNGNRIEEGLLADGRHFATFEDPFPKPAYLFALVAGDLRDLHEVYATASGRTVDLHLWSDPADQPRLAWAMECLKRAMRWDEQVFGLEYDLDVFHVVAARQFNMGAMENKGLNVFNASYLLASPETASDEDHELVEGVVGHEYFHNWTGNRVTCRDWFQLTLKEGLTIYRDQRFSAEMRSAAVKRIEDVRMLRARQFAEDAGPLAHPIRPEAYEAMDNFYTATVYLKGGEVVRLYETLLGKDGFRRGMDLYFARHDGQAVSCDDFLAAMADANGRDLGAFARWYEQAGTPVVEAEGRWDAAARTYHLRLRQLPARDGAERPPLPIPVAAGLLAADGRELAPTRTLLLEQREQEFSFPDVAERPVASLLRNFSAPVRLRFAQSDEELATLLAHDSDSFNRWEAGQRLATRALLTAARAHGGGAAPEPPASLTHAWRRVLEDRRADPSLAAWALMLPDEESLVGEWEPGAVVDPAALRAAVVGYERHLARSLADLLLARVRGYARAGAYAPQPAQIGPRRLRNRCLLLLAAGEHAEAQASCEAQWRAADNLSDAQAALCGLLRHPSAARERALAEARARWQAEPATLDKWFALQALSAAPDTYERVRALCADPDYTPRSPNRAMALLRSFARNFGAFHRRDGAGYELLAERVLEIDPLNPGLAARLAQPLAAWRRYAQPWGGAMHAQLERIARAPGLSKNTGEIVRLALADLQSDPATASPRRAAQPAG